MSDPTRHTRATAELAAYSRRTSKILKANLLELLGETVPEDGIFDVEAIEAPLSSSNMHVQRGSTVTGSATADHDRPTLRLKPLVRRVDE